MEIKDGKSKRTRVREQNNKMFLDMDIYSYLFGKLFLNMYILHIFKNAVYITVRTE